MYSFVWTDDSTCCNFENRKLGDEEHATMSDRGVYIA
jgi:hypothetical protein